MKTPIYLIIIVMATAITASAQTVLTADKSEKFTLTAKQDVEFAMNLKADELCNITTNASDDVPVTLELIDPAGTIVINKGEPKEGIVFVAETTGRYRLIFKWLAELSMDEAVKNNGKQITVRYTNKFGVPKNAVSKAVRNVNGYQARILDEPGDNGQSYLVIQKGGKIHGLARAEKELGGGLYFADDPSHVDGKRSAELFRTTQDKTGDGTPDIAVEYYTGGAHCCYEITFFELGEHVRQLPTIATDNDRLTAIAKLPNGGLRYEFADQAFAYWTINFAQSPMPTVIYEFKDDKLTPRFDLMKKPAPTEAVLKRKAAAAKAKINLNPYTDPSANFNDFDEPFWDYMLDLIYQGHEDLAWRYFDLVWPARKPGKDKFLADFKDQLAYSVYGEWHHLPKTANK